MLRPHFGSIFDATALVVENVTTERAHLEKRNKDKKMGFAVGG